MEDRGERMYGRNVPRMQNFVQGRTADGNDITKMIRQNRSVQPGNTFWRVVRIGAQPSVGS